MYEKLFYRNGYILFAENGKISLDFDGEHRPNEKIAFDLPFEWDDTPENREIALSSANNRSK
jgi:hypothetical protein